MTERLPTKAQLLEDLAAARREIDRLRSAAEGAGAGNAAPAHSTSAPFSVEALADGLPGVAYLYDCTGKLLWWNRGMERITGYSPEELRGMSMPSFVRPEDLPEVGRRFREVMEVGSAIVDAYLVAKDGTLRPHFFHGHRIEFGGGPCLIGMGVDLTERKEAEDSLRRSEARKSAMLEAALDCIITIDHKERILEFNPAAEKTFGVSRAEALGQALSELIIPPAYRDQHRRGMARFLQTGEGPALGRRIEMPAIRADGSEFPAELSIVPIFLDGPPIFTGYLRDITERKRAEGDILQLNQDLERRVELRTAELVASNEALERASRLKDEFLANMSHELRTPLGGVIGMVDLLSQTDLDGRQSRYVQVARGSAEILLDLISDILDLSRIESEKLELDRVDYSPAEVIAEVITMLSARAAEKRLELRSEVQPAVATRVSGDRGRMRQVITNLVANAVKFTGHGEVVVRASLIGPLDGGNFLRVEVADTGIGIPEDRVDRLFQSFSQVDASTSRRFGGTGLGLAICRRLAGLMGGEVGVDSVEGQGSTFWFTARLEPPLAQTPPAAESTLISEGESAVDGDRRPLRILVAEDSEANRIVAAETLRRLGHSAHLVEDGVAAIAAVRDGDFDLILMDIQMPGVDGLSAAAAIRAFEDGGRRRTPIVAVTACAVKGDRERCLSAGMDDYLTKPLRRSELIRVISDRNGPPAVPVARDGPPPAKPLDLGATLERLEGDRETLSMLIDAYSREWPRLADDMRAALGKSDWDRVGFVAHRLTGLARTFDAQAAVEATSRVEALAITGEVPPDLIRTVENLFERLSLDLADFSELSRTRH